MDTSIHPATSVALGLFGTVFVAAGVFVGWTSLEAMVVPQYGIVGGAIAIVIGLAILSSALPGRDE